MQINESIKLRQNTVKKTLLTARKKCGFPHMQIEANDLLHILLAGQYSSLSHPSKGQHMEHLQEVTLSCGRFIKHGHKAFWQHLM